MPGKQIQPIKTFKSNTASRVSAPKISKKDRYIVSPHAHAGNLYKNTYGLNLHRAKKGKGRVVAIFKNETQAHLFRLRAIKQRNQILNEIGPGTTDPRLTAVNRLIAMSSKNALYRFPQIGRAKTYVQSHGLWGSKRIIGKNGKIYSGKEIMLDDDKNIVTVKQLGTTLRRLGIPPEGELHIRSCYSGTENEIVASVARKNFFDNPRKNISGLERLSQLAGNIAQTLSGTVKLEMSSTHPNLSVFGYMGPTLQEAAIAFRSDGAKAESVGVSFDGPGERDFDVKGSHARREAS